MASFADSLNSTVGAQPLKQPEIAALAMQLATVAALAFGDRWLLSVAEADAISHPAARMLAKHTPVQKIIRHYTDPLVLIGIIGAVGKSRMFGRKLAAVPSAAPAQRAATAAPIAPAQVDAPTPPSAGVFVVDAAASSAVAAESARAMAETLAAIASIP